MLAKQLEDGSYAAGLFNVTDGITRKISLKWSDLGLKGKYIVRDLWRQKDIGVFDDSFSAEIRPHGAMMIGLRKPK